MFAGLRAKQRKLCDGLREVTLTHVNAVREDGTGAYKGNVFSDSPALATVTLEYVDFVGAEAFRGCKVLRSLTMSNVGTICRSSFAYCDSLNELALDGVTMSGGTEFLSCTGLETVTLKNMDVDTCAFSDCTSLKTVTMENIGTIGQQAFADYRGGDAT